MEIHAPESPVHSLKDFFIHISIVTLGILIALGLEGLREAVHNRHLVRETRENVHTEMELTLQRANLECDRVARYHANLDKLVAAMPALAKEHPAQFLAGLNMDANPGYFLAANSWDVALSTGVLAHIPTAEGSAYAYASQAVRTYSALQDQVRIAEARAKSYAAAHPQPTPDQIAQGMEYLLLFDENERELAYTCPQMQQDIKRALAASAP